MVKQKKIKYTLLYTKNYPYKDALEHDLRSQAAFSARLSPWPKDVLGGKIPNLCLKKPLSFSLIVIEGGLLHLLLERIGACF